VGRLRGTDAEVAASRHAARLGTVDADHAPERPDHPAQRPHDSAQRPDHATERPHDPAVADPDHPDRSADEQPDLAHAVRRFDRTASGLRARPSRQHDVSGRALSG